MPLKAKYKSESEIPEGQASLYRQNDDGEFVLDVEGMVPSSRVAEFRDNNIQLKKDLEKAQGQLTAWGEHDPADITEKLARLETLENSDLNDPDAFNEALDKRVGTMRTDMQNQIDSWKNRAETAEASVGDYEAKDKARFVDDAILGHAKKVGLQDGAEVDLLSRARTTWTRNEDGQLVALHADGGPIYGKNGTDPLTPEEWLESQAESAPYLFKESSGGGAQGAEGARTVPGRTINSGDQDMLNRSIDDIAEGKVHVNMP